MTWKLNFSTMALTAGMMFNLTSVAHATSISGTAEALGIDWTLSATDDVDAAYASTYEIMFSLRADVPTDLSLIVDEGETIAPTWIATAEARIAGLENFMLVSAPNGASGWYDLAGPSANDCRNSSGSAACAESMSDSSSADIYSGASHTWTWVGNVASLDRVFADDYSGLQHVGAHLENIDHRRGWNVSKEISGAVPEPSAALVFGVGIALAGTRLRRNEATTN
jgi:hypothetical protein